MNACSLTHIEVPKELPPEPVSTPIMCTPLPMSMNFQVIPLSHTSIAIELTGLDPGEKPTIIVQARTPNESFHLEETPSQSADTSGRFEWNVYGLELDSAGLASPLDWVVLVNHAQGVACTTVTLP